jgi:hypothetical protein
MIKSFLKRLQSLLNFSRKIIQCQTAQTAHLAKDKTEWKKGQVKIPGLTILCEKCFDDPHNPFRDNPVVLN